MTKVDEAVELYVEWLISGYNKAGSDRKTPIAIEALYARYCEVRARLNVGERLELRRRVYDRTSPDFDARLRQAERRYTG
jgi:hypothetical protein